MAKTKVLVGGRGTGKTVVEGVETYRNVETMPRSKGFILGMTYNQILNIVLPPMEEMWARYGLIRHTNNTPGHYVIGIKPPAYFKNAYQEPNDYSNVVSFINGSRIVLGSMDRKGALRGQNFDWGIVDEALLIDKERFFKEVQATIRANKYRFAKFPRHHSLTFATSMPYESEALWILDYEELFKENPVEYFFKESTVYDNVQILGEEYIARMKASTPPAIWAIEYMNQRVTSLSGGFYNEFKDTLHTYYDSYDYDHDDYTGNTAIKIKDYDSKKGLLISWDFGAKFTCMIVAQEHGRNLNIINSFWAKSDDDTSGGSVLEKVLKQFVSHYRGHQAPIECWGDRNGNNRDARSTYTMYQIIEQELRKEGFQISIMVRGLDPEHKVKNYSINEILSERRANTPRIRINRNTCKDLIMSIKLTPIIDDFKKDKKSERQKIGQEKATHLGDAFDNLVHPKYGHLVNPNDFHIEVMMI
jgi:hypothetical protein